MTFPDVENDVRLFAAGFVTVPVKIIVPNPRPDDFIRVWRTGGSAVNRILDAPLITAESWGSTGKIALDNLNLVREGMFNGYTAMHLVRGVEEVTGPYYDPDPVSGTERYSLTWRLMVRRPRA
jgi:hypothetical protein